MSTAECCLNGLGYSVDLANTTPTTNACAFVLLSSLSLAHIVYSDRQQRKDKPAKMNNTPFKSVKVVRNGAKPPAELTRYGARHHSIADALLMFLVPEQ